MDFVGSEQLVTLGIKFTKLLSKNTAEAISINKLDFYNNL